MEQTQVFNPKKITRCSRKLADNHLNLHRLDAPHVVQSLHRTSPSAVASEVSYTRARLQRGFAARLMHRSGYVCGSSEHLQIPPQRPQTPTSEAHRRLSDQDSLMLLMGPASRLNRGLFWWTGFLGAGRALGSGISWQWPSAHYKEVTARVAGLCSFDQLLYLFLVWPDRDLTSS